MELKDITTDMVLKDLSNGMTRLRKDDKGYGSLEEKYDLSPRDIYFLFQDPLLKGKRTKRPAVFPTVGLTVRQVVANAFKYFQFNKNERSNYSTR